MAISNIGFSSAEATSITVPTHQAGDLIIAFAFRDGSVTNPTIATGNNWTTITNTTDGTTCSVSAAYKVARNNAESSGTWTNSTGMVIAVYRGQATNKTPIGTFQPSAGTTNTITYAAVANCKTSSWIVAFGGHRSVDTTMSTAPAGMTNQTATTGATATYVGHDTNGVRGSVGSYPSTTVAISGTASGWQTMMIEIFNEENSTNNFEFPDANNSNSGIISVTEKIK